LAKSWHEHCHKVKGNIIVTTKLDGIRCAIVKENGVIKFISRQGQRFLDLTQLEKEAKLLPDNCVFDGELLSRNYNNLSSKDLYRLTMKMVSKDGEKTDIEFHMFDILSLEDFNNGKSRNCCETRKNSISEIVRIIGSKWIKEVPVLYHGDDYSMVKTLLDEALAKGVEGVMVNLAKSVYQCKRTDTLLKAKQVQSCDIEIVGFEEGDGKYKGTLGALVVDYKGNREVGVGSGLSDSDRAFIWANRENLIGTIVEVEYTEETNNQNNDLVSMRFPRFLRLRPDKIEPSYN
jgi:DNA ligase-1